MKEAVLNHLKNNLTPEINDENPIKPPYFIGPPDKYKPSLPHDRRMTRDEFRFMLLNFNNSQKVNSIWIEVLCSCQDVDAFLVSSQKNLVLRISAYFPTCILKIYPLKKVLDSSMQQK